MPLLWVVGEPIRDLRSLRNRKVSRVPPFFRLALQWGWHLLIDLLGQPKTTFYKICRRAFPTKTPVAYSDIMIADDTNGLPGQFLGFGSSISQKCFARGPLFVFLTTRIEQPRSSSPLVVVGGELPISDIVHRIPYLQYLVASLHIYARFFRLREHKNSIIWPKTKNGPILKPFDISQKRESGENKPSANPIRGTNRKMEKRE